MNSLKEKSYNAEIAFFGGSFTAIDRKYMISLLNATAPYIDRFKGIRISTRPDCIDEDTLSLLKSYRVTSIELGAQSMNEDVLSCNNRGHKASDVINASELIKSFGISLGLQMMTGLYKSTPEKDIQTALEFVKLKPDTVRIYPTVIMKHTELEKLYKESKYNVQSFDDTVELCGKLLCIFDENNIPVIRLGLHHSESLERDMVAGVYHPAFREICESKIMLDKLLSLLSDIENDTEIVVRVSPSCVSKMIGNKRSNLTRLNELGYIIKIVQDKSVKEMEVVLRN